MTECFIHCLCKGAKFPSAEWPGVVVARNLAVLMLEFRGVLPEHGSSSISALPLSSQAFVYIPIQVSSSKIKSSAMQI